MLSNSILTYRGGGGILDDSLAIYTANYPELSAYNLQYMNRLAVDYDSDCNIYAVLATNPVSVNQYLVSFDREGHIRFLKRITDTCDMSQYYFLFSLIVIPEENRLVISGTRNYRVSYAYAYFTCMSFSLDGELLYNNAWTDNPTTGWLDSTWGCCLVKYNGTNYIYHNTRQTTTATVVYLGHNMVNTSTGALLYSRMSNYANDFSRFVAPAEHGTNNSPVVQIITNVGYYWIKHNYISNTILGMKKINSIYSYATVTFPEDDGTNSTINISADFTKLFKLDADGNLVWVKGMLNLGILYNLNRIYVYDKFIYLKFYVGNETALTPIRQLYLAKLDGDGNMLVLLKTSFGGDLIIKYGKLLTILNTVPMQFGDFNLDDLFGTPSSIYRYTSISSPYWYFNRVNNIKPYLLSNTGGITVTTHSGSFKYTNSRYLTGTTSSITNLI